MVTNAAEVFEDLMSYNVFDTDKILEATEDDLRDAVQFDPGGNVSDQLLEKLAETDKAKAFALSNQFSKDVGEAKTFSRLIELQKSEIGIENQLNVGGDAENKAFSIFRNTRLSLGIDIEDTKAALAESRKTAFEVNQVEIRKLFLEEDRIGEILAARITTRGQALSKLAEDFNVTQEEARARVEELGLTVDEKNRVRK